MTTVSNTESNIRQQIIFLEDVKHYSRSGSAEDLENLEQLVASIHQLGNQIIPEVAGIIQEISGFKSSITYSPTKLYRNAERVMKLLEAQLETTRGGPPPLEERESTLKMPDSVRRFLEFDE